jgi:hypothetical protein
MKKSPACWMRKALLDMDFGGGFWKPSPGK